MVGTGKVRFCFTGDAELKDQLYALRAEPKNRAKSISELITEILAEALKDYSVGSEQSGGNDGTR